MKKNDDKKNATCIKYALRSLETTYKNVILCPYLKTNMLRLQNDFRFLNFCFMQDYLDGQVVEKIPSKLASCKLIISPTNFLVKKVGNFMTTFPTKLSMIDIRKYKLFRKNDKRCDRLL